jgi:hypothetical protein
MASNTDWVVVKNVVMMVAREANHRVTSGKRLERATLLEHFHKCLRLCIKEPTATKALAVTLIGRMVLDQIPPDENSAHVRKLRRALARALKEVATRELNAEE